LHIIEMIERHMPSSQHTGVCGGIFAQCIVTAHDVTVEFECAIRQEAISPSGRVLSVNGLREQSSWMASFAMMAP